MKRPVESPVREHRCMWMANRSDGSRTACCAREQWQVCLDTRVRRDAQVVRVRTPFKVCTRHKNEVTLSVMLDGGAWARLRKVLRDQGKKEPRRRLTELHFERVQVLEAKRTQVPEAVAEQHACPAPS